MDVNKCLNEEKDPRIKGHLPGGRESYCIKLPKISEGNPNYVSK